MKYFGGILLLLYTAATAMGWSRFPSDERGRLPPGVRASPGGILMWHDGFMGGK